MIHVRERFRLPQSHLQLRQFTEKLINIWQEFMQRRIEQTYRHRKAGHLAKDAHEIAALQRQKIHQGLLSRADAVGQNHLAHRGQPFVAKEHVFRAAKPDAFRAHRAGHARIMRRVGICADGQAAKIVGPFH